MLNNLSIKYKAYLLIAIGVVTAVLLVVIANIGLSSIKSKLDELVLSTNVERYAYLTILEEKNYLLNANASVTNIKRAAEAFENAKKDVETINNTLDKIDSTSSNESLLEKSKAARSGTKEYKELYYNGVDLLVNIGKETEKLEHEGELATLQAQEYVLEKRKQLNEKLDATLVKKTNIATDIWKLTYVIRADEKRYMLNPDPVIFERMKKDFATMLEHLDTLKKMASDSQEQEKITIFFNASKSYEAAAYKWVDLNKNLMTVVLPKMKVSGELVVKQAMEAAEEAQAIMIRERNSIVITSIIVAAALIMLSVLIGYIIANAISRAINNAKNVVSDIANGNLNSRIQIESNDEISELLESMQTMQNNLKTLVDEVNQIVNAALKGDFSVKINETGKNGFSKDVSSSLNQLSDVISTGLHDVIRVAEGLSNGDLSQKITKDYKGLFGLTAKGVNGTVDSLTKIVNEIQSMVDAAANHGEFSYKMNLSDKAGYTQKIAELLNQLSNITDDALNDIERIANALADGDLTQAITKEYPGVFGRVKVGVNATTENLKTMMTEIKETTEMISAVSKEISSGNNDLSHRTEQQAASLEETAASMQQLTATVQHNTESANQANELASGAAQTANKGVSVVQDVVSTMDNINESSLRIVDIISVIDDIAFQTNILALNAAVEAARAGEQGKGFAVVATEVRNLAQRAANAAGEIKRLINDSVERVSGGSRQVAEAGKTMQDIVDAIGKVTSIISEIANASEEQNAGIAQVGQAIGSMDEVTQQNAALVEEVAATAESLESQTSNLAKEMSHFKTGNEKAATRAVSSAPKKSASPTKSSVSTSVGTFSSGADDWEEF